MYFNRHTKNIVQFKIGFVPNFSKTMCLIASFFMLFFRLIRPDAPAQEEDKSAAEQDCPSSQEPLTSSLEPDEADCSAAQDSAATSSNGLILKETKEIAFEKASGANEGDADGTQSSLSERWETGRVGSMAARLLRDVQIPPT